MNKPLTIEVRRFERLLMDHGAVPHSRCFTQPPRFMLERSKFKMRFRTRDGTSERVTESTRISSIFRDPVLQY